MSNPAAPDVPDDKGEVNSSSTVALVPPPRKKRILIPEQSSAPPPPPPAQADSSEVKPGAVGRVQCGSCARVQRRPRPSVPPPAPPTPVADLTPTEGSLFTTASSSSGPKI
ncbi:hypothetical protein GCK72_017834 [Caenorhabditis remanei]|uniref:Uncharacterized protein n=1 Tax=Caenorhabditis remanei TaxID=31234 RepID=A0A6A5G8G8_CAERE|nr:hypothetical protein GCK72_017834 [Caenorhabditis remanei]KAF1751280.1 hypothetical protein GCK72_017834 [Caenorhabditis remanei]